MVVVVVVVVVRGGGGVGSLFESETVKVGLSGTFCCIQVFL